MTKDFLPKIKCDTVWAHSILENRQRGRVFTDDAANPQTILFWHYCGAAFIAGSYCDGFIQALNRFLSGTYEENQKQFTLFVNDEQWIKSVASIAKNMQSVKIGERLRFRFNYDQFKTINPAVPKGYALRETDRRLYGKLQGRNIPSLFWHSPEAFFENGKGYCMLDGDNIACNSLSAAVGNQTIDVGIETTPDYRMKGLAVPTAYAMVRYCADNGFEPNWGCRAENLGSVRIAQILGFEVSESHPIYAFLP